jgi:hypothetical protein
VRVVLKEFVLAGAELGILVHWLTPFVMLLR